MADPIFYDLVDKLYHEATDWMPSVIRDRDILLAPFFGYSGIRGVVKGLQGFLENFFEYHKKELYDIKLPKLERISQVAITLLPLSYVVLDPEGAKEIITQHPVYTSGMVGSWIGAMQQAQIDIEKRRHSIERFRYVQRLWRDQRRLRMKDSFEINLAKNKVPSYGEVKIENLKIRILNKINPFL